MTPDRKSHASTTTSTPPQLRIERVFDATPERLWTYWTDPAKYAKWLSPQKADLVIHEFDVRVGGRVKFDMPLDNGQVNHEEGVFHVLDKPRRLVSGSADRSFLLEVTFDPVDARRTRMTVVVDGVPPEYHSMATEGWGKGLDKLENLVAGKPARTDSAKPTVVKSAKAVGHTTADRYVHVERFFKAPPAKVFDAWTTPAVLQKFFWPVGEGKVKEFDLRVGGRLVMGHAKEPWTATWTYKEIVPGRRLVIEDHWDDGSGHKATGTMEFIAENGGTRLKVSHGPFPTTGPYKMEGAVGGFCRVADRLAEEVEVPGEGEGFVLERFFRATPQRLWEMWTTKEGLAKWWGPSARAMGYEFKVLKVDVRVGGQYDIQMSNEEHGELHNHGVYTEVKPHTRLAQRWDFDIFLGPGEKPYPIALTLDFEEVTGDMGSGTKMTFTQGPMAKPEFTEGSRQGVIQNLASLEKALGE